jgi:FAD/FMN-containing dehydrogenase
MHGDASPWMPLFEALKRRFDPSGVLNPGRFAGGL